MSDKKKEKYIKEYTREREEYAEKKNAFFLKHPELKSTRKRAKSLRQAKTSADYTVLTPFIYYWQKIGKNNKMREAQVMWKALPDKEKGKYIHELASLDTDQEKKISKNECAMAEKVDGFPGYRPMTMHNVFMKNFYAVHRGSTKGSLFAEASKVWAELTQREKDKLQKEVDVQNECWRDQMELWIKKQPLDKQPGLRTKFHLNSSKTKRKADSTSESAKKKTKLDKSLVKSSPKKEKKVSSSSSSDESDTVVQSPKKSKTNLESMFKAEKTDHPVIIQTTLPMSTPKKEKSKKLKEPEYPSQTTAHYFMTKIFSGKPNKVSKAYQKLSAAEKKKYREEMMSKKKNFLVEAGSYIKSLDGTDASKFQMNMKQLKAQQEDATHWHKSAGTDDEKKNAFSSDSDSDSDSS